MDVASLWDFQQPALSEQRFRAALAGADGDDAAVLRTQLARALALQGRFDEAEADLDAVAAGPERTPLVGTYLHLELGRVRNSSGRPAEAVPLFISALDQAVAAGLDHLAADAAHMLAIAETGEAQIPWARRALAIAEASADPRARRWNASVTHNLGWTLHDLGRHEEALAEWERALALRERQGDAALIRVGRWTVARGLRSLGRCEEALAIQRELDASGPHEGYVSEEIGELLIAMGQPEQARPHFARAHELLAKNGSVAPERLHRLAVLGSA